MVTIREKRKNKKLIFFSKQFSWIKNVLKKSAAIFQYWNFCHKSFSATRHISVCLWLLGIFRRATNSWYIWIIFSCYCIQCKTLKLKNKFRILFKFSLLQKLKFIFWDCYILSDTAEIKSTKSNKDNIRQTYHIYSNNAAKKLDPSCHELANEVIIFCGSFNLQFNPILVICNSFIWW